MLLANTLALKIPSWFHNAEGSRPHSGLLAKTYGKFAPQPVWAIKEWSLIPQVFLEDIFEIKLWGVGGSSI